MIWPNLQFVFQFFYLTNNETWVAFLHFHSNGILSMSRDILGVFVLFKLKKIIITFVFMVLISSFLIENFNFIYYDYIKLCILNWDFCIRDVISFWKCHTWRYTMLISFLWMVLALTIIQGTMNVCMIWFFWMLSFLQQRS